MSPLSVTLLVLGIVRMAAGDNTCTMYEGKNNGGSNLESTARRTSSYGECCSQCLATSACVGYTWVKGSSECWLKASVDSLKSDSSVVSGSVGPEPTPSPSPGPPPAPTPKPSPPSTCTMYEGKNNGGSNLESTARTTSSYGECCSQCLATSACVGYTWVRGSSECWLKASVDSLKSDSSVVSGSVGSEPTPSPGPLPGPCTPGSTPLACHGRLSLGGQYGTQIVDASGNAVQLKGMSVFNPGSYDDCISQDSVNFLASNWGIELLRIPMNGDPAVYNQRAQYVDFAKNAGIYAIIDFHYTGKTPIIDDNAKNFWRTMATRFKDHDNVFYELFNEPGPDADWNSDIKPFHEAMLNVIRPIDSEAIVLCGTRRWSQMVWQVPGNEVQPSKNVMYVRHSYAATHKDYDEVAAVLNQIPIFMTEWGVCDASGSGSIDSSSAQTWVDMMRAKSHNPYGVTISWCNWGYDDKAESCAALQPGACGAHDWDRTSQSGNMVKSYLKESVASGHRIDNTSLAFVFV